MKAKIWWGELKALDCVYVSNVFWACNSSDLLG
jgi:hypothetical protein